MGDDMRDSRALEIILIEDDEQFAELTSQVIEDGFGNGASCRVAATLSEGVHLHHPGQTDVFLLDLMLPDNTGLDGLRSLRALDQRAAIIVLTAREDHDVALASLREGAQDFIPKSGLDPATLPQLIEKAIARMERTRKLIDEIAMLRARLAAPAANPQRSEPLRLTSAELFDRLVAAYVDLLQLATGPSAKGAVSDLAEGTERLAADLAGANAGPGDVTDIHVEAVRHHSKNLAIERAAEATAEGQVLLIRLLGLTLLRYRQQVLEKGDGDGG